MPCWWAAWTARAIDSTSWAAQQGGYFFLDIDDDISLAQFLRESEILVAQLLNFNGGRIALHLGAAALRRQALEYAGGAFTPPGHKRRRI